MKILLLPGMDGTGKLFEPFLNEAPSGHNVIKIQLIQEEGVSFQRQAEAISNLINEPVILVAESYSGMIALELLKVVREHIQHVFFIASFISPPSSLSRLGAFLPSSLIGVFRKPNRFAAKILFGDFYTVELSRLFEEAIKDADSNVLTFRIQQIASIDKPREKFDVPATYIQARSDILVSGKVIRAFHTAFINLKVEDIEGTHFLLQTNPKKCWEIIQRDSLYLYTAALPR